MSRKAEIYKELHELQIKIDSSEKFKMYGNPKMKIIFSKSAHDCSVSQVHEFVDDPAFIKSIHDDLIQMYKKEHDELVEELATIGLESFFREKF